MHDVARGSAYQPLPMVIFTRSDNGDLVRLQDVCLPLWMHEHLRRYDRLNYAIHPEPAPAFSFADASPSPHDTVKEYKVALERYYRREIGHAVLEGAVIADRDQADRFIKYHQSASSSVDMAL
ncbi:hypothetical protein HMPREF1168_03419 [Aeromonas veronii AMC34]|uniref:Uncharacterized protein n=1 Tax=Aeromonas veronii AMC34 TaxID=1073383 RepID=K1IMQ9_AERVE|nr:hypothetical protein HMPREF1168_03419 [Aeromonas veronii AMC34]